MTSTPKRRTDAAIRASVAARKRRRQERLTRELTDSDALNGLVLYGAGDDCGVELGCLTCDEPNVGQFDYGVPIGDVLAVAVAHQHKPSGE